MVVAETRAQALDAAEAVEVDYEELPFVIHSEDAMQARRARGVGRSPGQRPGRHDRSATRGDRPRLRAAPTMSSTMDFHIVRVTGVPMEPRAALGELRRGERPLHAATPARGGAVRQKNELASVLGIAPDKLRVLSYDVGGNFGTRNRACSSSSAWCCGRRASSAARSNTPRRARRRSSATTRAAISSPRSSSRSTQDGRFLAHARRPTSAMSARAACRSRRCRKGSGLITGSYDIPAATLRAMRGVHQHHADPGLSLRPAGRR